MKKGNYKNHAAIWGLGEPDRSDEITFYAILAGKYGDNVLSLMCATGEIALGLAEKGFRVTGIDVEPAMLDIAREKSIDIANPVFIAADITALDLPVKDCTFAFIGTGDFHHLQTPEEMLIALNNIYDHLGENGGLTLELMYPADASWSSPEQTFDMDNSPETGRKVWKTSSNSYIADTMRQYISQEVFIEEKGKTERFSHELEMQLIDRDTLVHLFDRSGFRIVAEYGGYDFCQWQPGTGKWIVEARKYK